MVGAWNPPSEGNTIEAFADAAQSVSVSSAPSSRRGGVLLEDEEIASLTSGNASPTESGRSVLVSLQKTFHDADSISTVPALLALQVALPLQLPRLKVPRQQNPLLRLLVPLE